ncbi:sulfurtransferase [Natrononativus amylolyticus]|uniref:sulfurtransferase n=1 Tax=Natrononativus amylolyticus TaxID=2963434 RepID=UPI0020CD0C3D|nr:rhodanese-like domain-containing protein [Natrononativus amylolyticus]
MTDEPNATRRALLQAAAGTAVAGTAGCTAVTTPADTSVRSEVRGNVRTFVGPSWLTDRDRDEIAVIDARERDAFRRERIHGARHVALEALTTRRDGDGGLEPDPSEIAAGFAGIGVAPDDDVLVYGNSVGSRVTRVAFALAYLGHRGDVRILNGGVDAWTGRIGTGTPDEPEATEYEADPVDDLVATRRWLADEADRFGEDAPDSLVDVRVPEAYLGAAGSDALDPDHQRHGHLPGAINVHWLGNVSGTRLQEPTRLARLFFAEAGLEEEETVVVYGDDNVDPTQTWAVLRALGFEDVRLYEGGFTEWANVPEDDRGGYPVETKTNVVIETDGDLGGEDGGDFSCTG